jgi:hypothetical protein
MMSLLNMFEPNQEVVEKDATFLYLKRKKEHYYLCSIKYQPQKSMQFKKEL